MVVCVAAIFNQIYNKHFKQLHAGTAAALRPKPQVHGPNISTTRAQSFDNRNGKTFVGRWETQNRKLRFSSAQRSGQRAKPLAQEPELIWPGRAQPHRRALVVPGKGSPPRVRPWTVCASQHRCGSCQERVWGAPPPSHRGHSCSGGPEPTCAGSLCICPVPGTRVPALGLLELVTLSLALNYCGCWGALLGVNDHTRQLFGSTGDHGLGAERSAGLQGVL